MSAGLQIPPKGGTTNLCAGVDPGSEFVVPPSGGAFAVAVRWMNRGHERMGADAGMEALVAYVHAIALLRPLPLSEHPAWANSLGASLMNYGQLLHRVHGLSRAGEALNAFAEAIAVLAPNPATDVPWARRNLAGTHINRANLLLALAAESRAVLQLARRATNARAEAPRYLDRAGSDAQTALKLVAATERGDLVDADLALKARRVLCDALGQQLPRADAAQQDAFATEAADVVDDALSLVRHWTARGESSFAPLAVRFFRFGTELYRRHQPHFLIEFIEENIVAAPECTDELRVIAHLALNAALADGAAPALQTLGDPASERALQTRVELAAARARLEPSSLVA